MRLAELEIPASAEYVSVARLVVSSIAHDRYEVNDDQLDNLKLAVSEACVMAIEAGSTHSSSAVPVAIRCEGGEGRLEVIVERARGEGNGRGDGGNAAAWVLDETSGTETRHHIDPDLENVERQLGIPLIGSLVDEVLMETPPQSSRRVRMTLFCELAEPL